MEPPNNPLVPHCRVPGIGFRVWEWHGNFEKFQVWELLGIWAGVVVYDFRRLQDCIGCLASNCLSLTGSWLGIRLYCILGIRKGLYSNVALKGGAIYQHVSTGFRSQPSLQGL